MAMQIQQSEDKELYFISSLCVTLTQVPTGGRDGRIKRKHKQKAKKEILAGENY
jgi:hypothetical protein